jgi:ABC-type phosphate transport system substrate-binding protein
VKSAVLACSLFLAMAAGGKAVAQEWTLPPPGKPAASRFLVIVNAGNPVASLPKTVVSNFLLKRAKTWGDGERSKPVDLQVTSPTRESFSRAVHGQSAAAIEEFWQRQIYSGRDVPPPRKASEAEVMEFVARNPGAIGYVAAGSRLQPGVKAVHIQEGK